MTKINTNAKHICSRLQREGHSAFIVGGAVRDMIMNRQPKDWDIVTSAKPEEIKAICSDMRPIGVGESYGIVAVIFNDEQFEIATMRCDGDYSDGRRPDSVDFVDDIELDLSRRDFTINAIAWDPIRDIPIDPFCGGHDIAVNFISCVGNAADRFNEDKLRILRAYRFMAQLGFDLDEEIVETVKTMVVSSNVFNEISQERITAELSKILIAPNCVNTVVAMARDGILQQIIPEIQVQIECEHESPWHQETWEGFGNTVFAHTLHVMDELSKSDDFQNADNEKKLVLMLSALLHDVGKPACKKIKEV